MVYWKEELEGRRKSYIFELELFAVRNEFRLAEQGKQSDFPVLILGFIAYILIGLL